VKLFLLEDKGQKAKAFCPFRLGRKLIHRQQQSRKPRDPVTSRTARITFGEVRSEKRDEPAGKV